MVFQIGRGVVIDFLRVAKVLRFPEFVISNFPGIGDPASRG